MRTRILLLTALPVVVLIACSGATSTNGLGNCLVGSAACACTSGGGCNPGLLCLSQTCVEPRSSDAGADSTVASDGHANDVSSDTGEVDATIGDDGADAATTDGHAEAEVDTGSDSPGDAHVVDAPADASDSGAVDCGVSWSVTVFPSFKSTGNGQCAAASCHGGTNAPTMVYNDPTTTLTNLTKYTINGVPYIAAGNTNPTASSIECNVGITTPACGIAQMPEAPGVLTATDRANITAWLECGAPNN